MKIGRRSRSAPGRQKSSTGACLPAAARIGRLTFNWLTLFPADRRAFTALVTSSKYTVWIENRRVLRANTIAGCCLGTARLDDHALEPVKRLRAHRALAQWPRFDLLFSQERCSKTMTICEMFVFPARRSFRLGCARYQKPDFPASKPCGCRQLKPPAQGTKGDVPLENRDRSPGKENPETEPKKDGNCSKIIPQHPLPDVPCSREERPRHKAPASHGRQVAARTAPEFVQRFRSLFTRSEHWSPLCVECTGK